MSFAGGKTILPEFVGGKTILLFWPKATTIFGFFLFNIVIPTIFFFVVAIKHPHLRAPLVSPTWAFLAACVFSRQPFVSLLSFSSLSVLST